MMLAHMLVLLFFCLSGQAESIHKCYEIQNVPICSTISTTNQACQVHIELTAMGILVVKQNLKVDGTESTTNCPSINGCATCFETVSGADGSVCVVTKTTCATLGNPVRVELGCFPSTGSLGSCSKSACNRCNTVHGDCVNATCVCRDGWQGDRCDLDPGAFYRCNTAKVGKDWHVCGSTQVDGCEIVSTMDVDKNELVNQKVPLLLALKNGGYDSCMTIETCSVCVKMTNLHVVLPAKDKVQGQLTSVVSGCGKDSTLPLGMFESSGDFSDVETRCKMKCTQDCSNRGTCNLDGTCTCTQGYGPYCQYLECSNCPTSVGTCDSLTGKCKCHNDDCTDPSTNSGNTTLYAVLGVVLFFIVSAGVGFLVYKWKKNRDHRRAETLQFMNEHSDGTGLSDLENFNASSDFEL